MNSQVKGAPTIFQVCDELDNPIIGAETNTCPSIQENSFPHAVKPVVVWVGGKRKLLQKWSENMPIHSRNPGQYFEPFVGGGAVMLRNDFNNVTISDLNFDLINMYKVIRDNIDALKNKLKIHEKNHEEHEQKAMNKDKRSIIFQRLQANDPAPTTELEYASPFELLISAWRQIL